MAHRGNQSSLLNLQRNLDLLAYTEIHPTKPTHVMYASFPHNTSRQRKFCSLAEQRRSLQHHSFAQTRPEAALSVQNAQDKKTREPQSFKAADVFDCRFYCSVHILRKDKLSSALEVFTHPISRLWLNIAVLQREMHLKCEKQKEANRGRERPQGEIRDTEKEQSYLYGPQQAAVRGTRRHFWTEPGSPHTHTLTHSHTLTHTVTDDRKACCCVALSSPETEVRI